MNVNARVHSLINHYGDGTDGGSPSAAQWRAVLVRDPAKPFALINFFKFRTQAKYDDQDNEGISGSEAFAHYAQVSIPSMKEAGGEFLAVAPFASTFIGAQEDWDLVAIGKYPNLNAFLALYENEAYIRAFRHRIAAVETQRVLVMEA